MIYQSSNIVRYDWSLNDIWIRKALMLFKKAHLHGNAHYSDVIMSAMASQITSLIIVCSTVYSGADQRKHQSSASLAFVRGIHRSPVNSPHKRPVTRKTFPFDDVIIWIQTFLQRDFLTKSNNLSTSLGLLWRLLSAIAPQMSNWPTTLPFIQQFAEANTKKTQPLCISDPL